jgi:hypothetical protein
MNRINMPVLGPTRTDSVRSRHIHFILVMIQFSEEKWQLIVSRLTLGHIY